MLSLLTCGSFWFYTAQGGSTDIALYSLITRGGVLEYEYTTVDSHRGISAG